MEQILQQYGLAGLVISVLSGVVVILYRKNDDQRKKYEELQEKRLADAITARDRITGPMEELTRLGAKMYELLRDIDDKKGS